MNLTVMCIGAGMTVVGLIGALIVGSSGWRMLCWKVLASTGFLSVAVGAQAFESTYGKLVFAALAGCWIGDVALSLEGDRPFLIGLVAFLLGHLLLVAAFFGLSPSVGWCLAALVAALVVAAFVLRWIYPHLPGKMRVPVLSYMLVISAMAVLAVGAQGNGATILIPVGAILFYVSDLFVARDHFTAPGYSNRILGLPLYYTATSVLAFSIAAQ